MELYVAILCMVAPVWLLLISSSIVGTCQGRPVEEGQTFFTWDDLNVGNSAGGKGGFAGQNSTCDGSGECIIVVSQSGDGDSMTVQGAVDMVPVHNKQRVKISIKPGIYKEKVTVPKTKPFISFIGSGSTRTVISWGAKASDLDPNGKPIGTFGSATVSILSDYFGAYGITFVNSSPDRVQAVALRFSGDKGMLKGCRILGFQDTLLDHQGRHYFLQCYIEGSVDFICGSARSLYEKCTLHMTAKFGSVTASHRDSENENSGFSFLGCEVYGSGKYYLGRTWGMYSRTVYSLCIIDGNVLPQGWTTMGEPSFTRTAWFGEYNCKGQGADRGGRVAWSKSLSHDAAKPFTSIAYIDGDQWLNLTSS